MTKKEQKKHKAEYSRRIKELRSVQQELQCAYSTFNNVTDPDMMDACIFEISALKSRVNYAVSGIRKLEETKT